MFGKEPDKGVMEVFNDYNADLINLYRCVKNRTWELLQVLGFLPLNSRDEFMEIKSFLEMGECGRKQVAEELELAFHNLPPAEFEEMQGLLQGKAVAEDVRRAAAFYKIIRYSYGSGCTSYSCQPFEVRKVFSLIREAAERLADTVIENKDFEALMLKKDDMAADVGSVLYGEEAVQVGLIDQVGGLADGLACLHRQIRERKPQK